MGPQSAVALGQPSSSSSRAMSEDDAAFELRAKRMRGFDMLHGGLAKHAPVKYSPAYRAPANLIHPHISFPSEFPALEYIYQLAKEIPGMTSARVREVLEQRQREYLATPGFNDSMNYNAIVGILRNSQAVENVTKRPHPSDLGESHREKRGRRDDGQM